MSGPVERVDLFVSGMVQGVGYRAAAQAEAERLGLSGEVRNLPDGRVELTAEGPREALEALVRWCRTGPPHAQVAGVEAEFSPARGGFHGFWVTRTPR